MAGKKRKVGRVRKKPARRGPPSRAPRTVGGVKKRHIGPVRAERSSAWGKLCCEGVEVGGHWYHTPGCAHASVGWEFAGWTEEDWNCPWRCTPTKFASSWAHAWDCPHWPDTNETPFDGPTWTPKERQEEIPF